MQNADNVLISKLPQDLVMGLADFLVNGVGEKAYDGISYELLLGVSAEDRKKIQKYDDLRTRLTEAKFNPDQILAKYKVANGFVYELNLKLVSEITYALAQVMAKETGDSKYNADLVNDGPQKRRNADMVKLKNHIVNTAKKQIQAQIQHKQQLGRPIEPEDKKALIKVALFSRNAVPVILYTVGDMKYTYQAYALRPKDLMAINEHIIQHDNLRILSDIQICDILPSKTGVAVTIPVEVI